MSIWVRLLVGLAGVHVVTDRRCTVTVFGPVIVHFGGVGYVVVCKRLGCADDICGCQWNVCSAFEAYGGLGTKGVGARSVGVGGPVRRCPSNRPTIQFALSESIMVRTWSGIPNRILTFACGACE